MPTSKNGIRKPTKVERARTRLDAAIARLESAINVRGGLDAEEGASSAARMLGELEQLRDENVRLRTLNRTVTSRLDDAIGRIRTVIAE